MTDARSRPRSQRATLLACILGAATALPAQSLRLVADVRPGASGSMTASEYFIAPSPRAGEVFLVLGDHTHDTELWRSDGTAAGTRLVIDLTPGSSPTTFYGLDAQSDGLWFVILSPFGEELWHTDGTAAGTTQVLTATSLGVTSLRGPSHWFPDGRFILTIDGTLWVSDGTIPGTTSLSVPEGGIYEGAAGRFWVWDQVNRAVWDSDGTRAGSSVVANNVVVATPAFGGLLILQRSAPSQTNLQVLGVSPAPQLVLPELATLVAFDDTIALLGTSTLWRWSGSGPAITVATFSALFDPITYAGPLVAAHDGPALFFTADDGVNGREPWWTDLTPNGTRPLGDLSPGVNSTPITAAFHVGDQLVFWAHTAAVGNEPWTSDGTAAGTTLLADLEPGPGDSSPDLFSGVFGITSQRRAVFPVVTTALGKELWITDGTAAGSRFAGDFNPGPASSLLFFGGFWAWPAGSRLMLFANDGVHGFEPCALDFEGAATPLLSGCMPTTQYWVRDPVLGASWELRTRQTIGVGVALIALPAATPLPFAGRCLLQLDLATSVQLAAIVPDARGDWTASFPLPNAPSLRGAALVTQAVILGPTQPLRLELCDAWFLTLGY